MTINKLDQLDGLTVRQDETIRDALQAIDRGACEISLVVDSEGCLLGVLSDGDLRRALLAGHQLDDPLKPHITTAPITVSATESRAAVLDLMQAHSISQVPAIDSNGHLAGLHLLSELLGHVERPNTAVIMAGGRGTRLAPMTQDSPKPMIRVAGRPILERLVLHLAGFGIRRVVLAVNYKAEVIENHFGDGSAFGCKIDYLREAPEVPLGTAGALGMLEAQGLLNDHPVLTLNGDLVTQADIGALLLHHQTSDAVATVAVRQYIHAVPFGVLEMEGDRIISMQEKPVLEWPVSAGMYVLDPLLFARIPSGVDYPLPTLIADAMSRGERVVAWDLRDDWHDVGRFEELRRAQGHA